MITSLIVLETELNADISMQLGWVGVAQKKKEGKMRTTISEMNGGDASRQTTQEEKISVTKTQRQHKDASPELKEKQNSTVG